MEPVKEIGVETKIDMEVSVHVCRAVISGKGRQTTVWVHVVKVVNVISTFEYEYGM